MHRLMTKTREGTRRSQLADLEEQLREYESLKADYFEPDALNVIDELPALLIKVRIAQGLRQEGPGRAAQPEGAAYSGTRQPTTQPQA